MSSIDERVVDMKFNNAQFEQGIKQTLASLDALAKKLQLENAGKGLQAVSSAAQNVQLGHIHSAVDGIAQRFKAMEVVAVTALATIAHQAVVSGGMLVKSLTIDPIKQGLQEYQTNINSIQTILSNTRWQNTGLDDVNKALKQLNDYSDQTIYNFSQMARNIGTFTAAGVSLDVATGAIKGIANLAAVSGSNAEQASMAMYQLSQALATGTVKLIDWNSVVNAGMGGKVFQDALMQTAKVHGVAIDEMLKDAGSFRATLEQGWLSAEILTETLKQFTGDLTREQVISMGYTEEQADAIIAMGKDAQDAATKVKTITQLFSTLRESAGSGWAQTWQLIFGDFEEARTFFTSVNDTLGGFIKTSADARNELLGQWKALGGRTVLIDALTQAFNVLGEVINPIKLAFRDVFPATTAQQLYNITVAVRDFFSNLKQSEDTMTNMRRTWAGVFAIFGIGIDILKQVLRVIFELFGMVGDGSGNFLEATANVGDFFVALRAAIKEGDGLIHFFDGVKRVLTPIVLLFNLLGKATANLFGGFDANQAAEGVVNFAKELGPVGKLIDFVVYAWGKAIGFFGDIFEFFAPLSNKFVEIWQDVSEAVGGVNFGDALAAINTGALVAFVVVLRNTFGRGGITGIFSELTGVLSSMQTTLQATTLLEIALAVGILAVAISVLSKIDSEGLTKALSAMAIMFTQLLASLAILTQIPGNSVVRLYVMAAAMTVMAVAVVILATAVRMMSGLSWEELAKGLTGVVILLAAITASAALMPDGARLISAGLGIIAMSVAIKILASAVSDLSGLSWEEMARGLTGVGALLAALTLFTRFAGVNAGGVLAGAGLILLAVSIKILASAISDLSGISWENIGKGMAVIATSLGLMTAALMLLSNAAPTAPLSALAIAIVSASMLLIAQAVQQISGISWENVGKGMAVIAVALTLISAALLVLSNAAPTALLSAGAIFVVALAMEILADALIKMGGMGWGEIVKGLVAMGGAMLILVIGLNAMQTTLGGAAALFVAASALAILAPVLKMLGTMSIGEIVKGLIALAAVFVILGVAAALMQPIIPALLGLGIAIALIGAGLALAGAGVFLFAAGLAALSVAGAGAAAAVVAILSAVIGLIPVLAKQVGIALLILIDVLIEGVPKIVELIIKLIIQLLDGLDQVLPKLAATVLKLILLILVILEEAVPEMVEAGLHILIGILEGIRDNIYRVVTVVGQIIENFLRALGDAQPGIIQAGVDMILDFIRGLTDAINNNAEAMGEAGADLAIAIVNGMVRGLGAGSWRISNAAKDMAKKALSAAMNVLGINSPSKEFEELGEFSGEGMARGLKNYIGVVEKSAEDVGLGALAALRDSLSGMSDLVLGEFDTTPTITPVLDLSNVSQEAQKLSSMLGVKPFELGSTYSAARQASAGYTDNKDSTDDNASAPGDTYNYTQNNTSPKALSTAEIYRQTKNQLSAKKGGLPN